MLFPLLPLSGEAQEFAGYGLEASVDGHHVLAGNQRLLEKYGVSCADVPQQSEGTLVACAADGRYMGFLLLADTLKEDAPRAVAALKGLGIENIQMLSGDKLSNVAMSFFLKPNFTNHETRRSVSFNGLSPFSLEVKFS